jgi:serum/glucocorticoid-regulated kinase 2
VSKPTGARNNASHFFTTSPVPSPLPTPAVSPKVEIADPFFDDLGAVAVGASNSANLTITGLAAYLTTLSNDQVFRQARPWKRFVRVRTDDLESVRVERAFRRVRSDVAMHITSPSTVNATMHSSSVLHNAKRSGTNHEPQEAETHEKDDSSTQDTESSFLLDNSEGVHSPVLHDTASTSVSARSVIEIEASDDGSSSSPNGVARPPVDHVVDPVPSTPVPTEHPSRIPNSQSTDPDKVSRLSSVYNLSSTSVGVSGAETTSLRSDIAVHLTPTSAVDVIMHSSSVLHGMRHAETDHESREEVYQWDDWSVRDTNQTPSLVSSSYICRQRLHDTASISALTNSEIEFGFSDSGSIARPTSPSPSPMSSFTARKVRMSDFEMIRMLGKGCAGKVLLVRHKGSSRLYALKAITKRHVLAHQELQHTLTEQAVLRRMAAEGIDPFVVKLWWSFHDKENLFLVMVRLPCIHAAMFPSVTCCHVLS